MGRRRFVRVAFNVQHRCGPVRVSPQVIDDSHSGVSRIYRGNKQDINPTGNLLTDDSHRPPSSIGRLPSTSPAQKLGHVGDFLKGEKAEGWLDRVPQCLKEKTGIERVFVIHGEAYDWNCPQQTSTPPANKPS